MAIDLSCFVGDKNEYFQRVAGTGIAFLLPFQTAVSENLTVRIFLLELSRRRQNPLMEAILSRFL